jgi:hypothetical protein
MKENALMVICNQEPPAQWLSYHPTVRIKAKDKDGKEILVPMPYIPIERVEYLLTRIFGKWWIEIKDSKIMANSVVITVRLFVTNPITGEVQYNDGIGANPIQTNAGAGAMDWNAAKYNGVQLAAPAAETYAVKDAAEKFGKLFGKDITRKGGIEYNSLLKMEGKPTVSQPNPMQEWIDEVNKCETMETLEAFGLSNKDSLSTPEIKAIFTKRKVEIQNAK